MMLQHTGIGLAVAEAGLTFADIEQLPKLLLTNVSLVEVRIAIYCGSVELASDWKPFKKQRISNRLAKNATLIAISKYELTN